MEMCTGPILIISCCKFVIQVGFQLGAIQFDEVADVNSLQMCTSNKDRICQWITSHRWPLNCAVNNNTTAALTLPLYNSCNYDRPSNPLLLLLLSHPLLPSIALNPTEQIEDHNLKLSFAHDIHEFDVRLRFRDIKISFEIFHIYYCTCTHKRLIYLIAIKLNFCNKLLKFSNREKTVCAEEEHLNLAKSILVR